MNKVVLSILYFFCLSTLLFSQNLDSAVGLKEVDPYAVLGEVVETINESVFEVVLLKPTIDSLSYEKPLPLHQIPYSVRTDKYESIGTAFAISETQIISAAHVFDLQYTTQFKGIYIRDKNKLVYEVGEVYKYSDHKDFVEFTVKNRKVDKYLSINENPKLNEPVFSVGNALGDGIVIRNGFLTSKTPEDENGDWEWLRYSAPASPGNSGGPLLDKNGNIIGMITAKSENENLNYALPISIIMRTEDKKAVLHSIEKYTLNNTYKDIWNTLNYETELPKEYNTIKKELTDVYADFRRESLNKFLVSHKESIFPNGKDSLDLLYTTYSCVFPNLIGEGEDGNWSVYNPKEKTEADLEKNGYIEYGEMSEFTYIYFQAPDNIPLENIIKDPKIQMDLILKGVPLYREIGDEKIRIVSLGKPYEEYIYIDNYKRKWLARTWLMEHDDTKLLSFSLLVPRGTITIMAVDYTCWIDTDYLYDLEKLTNFVYFSYRGSFSDWKEFLNYKDYLPDSFSSISFSFNENKRAIFNSKRLSFDYSEDFFNISNDSIIELDFTYFLEDYKVVWDISRIYIGEDENNDNIFYINRIQKPEEGLKKSYFSDWEKLTTEKYPYNKSVNIDKGQNYIKSIHPKYDSKSKNQIVDQNFVYSLLLSIEGNVEESVLTEQFDRLGKLITIHE